MAHLLAKARMGRMKALKIRSERQLAGHAKTAPDGRTYLTKNELWDLPEFSSTRGQTKKPKPAKKKRKAKIAQPSEFCFVSSRTRPPASAYLH